MKPSILFTVFFLVLIFSAPAQVQNVLPEFSVRELTKGKIQVSWENPFPSCIQLAIQRSADSSKNFRTIFSSQSPELPANGFVDNKPLQASRIYYRIFYVLSGGDYYFSKVHGVETSFTPLVIERPVSKTGPVTFTRANEDRVTVFLKKRELFHFTRPKYLHFRDSINTRTRDALYRINDHAVEWRPSKNNHKKEIIIVYGPEGILRELNKKNYRKFKDSLFTKTKDSLTRLDEWHVQFRPFLPETKEYISIYSNGYFIMQVEADLYKRFKDSIAGKTKDTLYSVDRNRSDIHPFVPKYAWKPSVYVFTNAQGYVTISLPLVKQHAYHIIFYEEDGSELFRIKTIKDAELVLDKANFIHAGWFHFELFEDNKLKEKNKFQLQRD